MQTECFLPQSVFASSSEVCMSAKSLQSCLTLCDSLDCICPWNFPGKNVGLPKYPDDKLASPRDCSKMFILFISFKKLNKSSSVP